jgi:hypothetical protein
MITRSHSRRGKAATAAALLLLGWMCASPSPAAAQLGSLIVTMTSPSDGSTVSSTITVSASVTIIGLLTVAGVQFQLDGAHLGAEDTTAPYSVSWNTTTASNGSHTLTAVARDILGLEWTSEPVTVTVSNLPTITSFTPASGPVGTGVTISGANFTGATAVRFNGASASFTVNSATSIQATVPAGASSGPISVTTVAGTATSASAFTVTASAPTIASFTPSSGPVGTGVMISGTNFTGATGVAFNGTSANFTVNSTTSIQADVPAGATTGPIAVSTPGGTATSASAFTVTTDAPLSTATRFEETDLSVVYTPGSASAQPPLWFQGSRSRDWSNATAAFNRSAGARATFRFTGTSATWVGFKAFWAGIARVSVDGGPLTDVDLFLPRCNDAEKAAGCVDEQVRAPAFTASGLAAGQHTMTIEATGLKHGAAGCDPTLDPKNCAADCAVVVDAFDVGPSSAPPPNGTRSEETAASLAYTAGWAQGDRTRTWSGGAAAKSGTPGARATFTFTGTSVSWIGVRGPAGGVARVYLDGALHAEVDTYSPTEIQAVVLTVTDLEAATHTLAIEASGQKNAQASDNVIAVDAFDVRSRFEEQDPSIAYTSVDSGARWILENRDRAWSGTTANSGGGSAAYSRAGTRAEFSFTGIQVTWIGFRGPFAGIADVSLDGAFAGRIDLYSSSEELQVPVFSASGLTAGPHILRIDVTGGKNAASADSIVVVDAFEVTPPAPGPRATRFQDTDSVATYAPTREWTQVRNAFYSGGASISTTAGARVVFTFTGTSVRWISQRGRDLGIARVYLDGSVVGEFDTFVPAESQERFQAPVFRATGLAPGSHTLTIEVTGLKNVASGGMRIVVDAFDVY